MPDAGGKFAAGKERRRQADFDEPCEPALREGGVARSGRHHPDVAGSGQRAPRRSVGKDAFHAVEPAVEVDDDRVTILFDGPVGRQSQLFGGGDDVHSAKHRVRTPHDMPR